MAVPVGLESGGLWRSGRSAWSGRDTSFSGSFSRRSIHEEDDEEALKWAALEKLPTYDRLRKSVLNEVAETGSFRYQHVDVTTLSNETRKKFIERVLQVAEVDNERFLTKLKERIDRVGIVMPTIEVRFEHLNIEADARVGGRALPTLLNFTVNIIEVRNETQDPFDINENQDMCNIQAWILIYNTSLQAILWLRPSGYCQSASTPGSRTMLEILRCRNQIQNLPSLSQPALPLSYMPLPL